MKLGGLVSIISSGKDGKKQKEICKQYQNNSALRHINIQIERSNKYPP